MNPPFTGQVVLITGASRGIGRATALAFANAGAHLVLTARDQAALQTVAGELPATTRTLIIPADLTSDADCRRIIDETFTGFGQLDILINNAGFGVRASVDRIEPDDARRLIDVNFYGPVRLIHYALPKLKAQPVSSNSRRAQIVNIGSVLSIISTPRNSLYCAGKSALRAFSDSLRLELRDAGIDVIFVMPGYTDTEFFAHQVRYGGPEHLTPFRGQSPDKVANAILNACRQHRREISLTMTGKLGIFLKNWFPAVLDFTLPKVR